MFLKIRALCLLTPKIGRFGQTRLDGPTNPVRLPWTRSLKGIWTSPLDSSRRVDQDPYIECPIWIPSERDMASGRSGRRTGG
jgi:hypothetical protein